MRFDAWDNEVRTLRAQWEQMCARSEGLPRQQIIRSAADAKRQTEELRLQVSKDINAILNASLGSHSYLSEKAKGLINWAKVFAEKTEKFCETYVSFLDRLLWAKLLVFRLTGSLPKMLSNSRMPFYTQKLKDLCELKASLEKQLQRSKTIQNHLRSEYMVLQITEVNSIAQHSPPGDFLEEPAAQFPPNHLLATKGSFDETDQRTVR